MTGFPLDRLPAPGSRSRRLTIWCAALFIVYSLLGFFVLPSLLKYGLEKKIPAVLQRNVAIDKVRFNPYVLKLTLHGFELVKKDQAGAFVAFDELMVNVQAASLYKRALIVKQLTIIGPHIDFSRNSNGLYSFSDLLAAGGKEQEQATETSGPFLFSVNNIEITNGNIRFDDQPKSTVHQVKNLQVAIPSLSNLPYNIETFVEPSFAALINGTQLDLGGMVKPFADSQETLVDIKMAGIDIPSYLSYIPDQGGLDLRSALVDLDLKVSFGNLPRSGARLAVTGTMAVRDVMVADQQGRTYLNLPRLELQFADSNLLDKKVHLTKVAVVRPEIGLWRQADGSVLPLALLPGSSEKPPAPATASASDAEGGLVVDVDLFELSEASALFLDHGLSHGREAKLEVDSLTLHLNNFSTAANRLADFEFSLRLGGGGSLQGKGRMASTPLQATLDYDLNALALKPVQPYIQEHLHVALAGGSVSSKGHLLVETEEDQLVSRFQGAASLDGLALVENRKGEHLLGWHSLQLGGIDFSTQPRNLNIGEVVLDGLTARLMIHTDGTSNIGLLAVESDQKHGQQEQQEEERAEQAAPAQVAIKEVKIVNGRIDFIDHKVRPSYAAALAEISGSIQGLSSQRSSQAVVDIRGKVNKHAPLEVSGKINPLQDKLFVDLLVDFRDLDLSHTSPYTGTYLGYKTQKGKLNFDLHYLVDDRDLTGENKLFLDQFTLGESVDSPDDLGLPISLALALLKNRKGEISLDLPVAGNLDDPEFSIGGVVFQVLVNLIAKAATSPFALLGSLIPEGEDLQIVHFQPGLAELGTEGQEKLDKMAYVLVERPGLRMDIRGEVNPAEDRPALTRKLLVQMVKLQKLQASNRGSGLQDVDDSMQISAEEYERYLQRLFKVRMKAAAVKPTPLPKTPAEMEKYILAGLNVADGQLRLLAVERANQALHYLTDQGGIAAERLFVLEPEDVAVNSGQEVAAAARFIIK